MALKTILVHADESQNVGERVELASMIAADAGATLVGAALTGVSRLIYEAGLISDNDPNLTVHLSTQTGILRGRAENALASFAQTAEKSGARFETQLIDDEEEFILRTRRHDLVVIGQYSPDEPSLAVTPEFQESVVTNSARPVLVVPYAGHFERAGTRVMIGWDDSIAAARAVANAIPIIRQASSVDIVVFNADEDERTFRGSGEDIAIFLAHHDIKANVLRQKTSIDVGNALLSMATDIGSDLLVMGAYGHSRFREMLLGGVTRSVLKLMTVPVLMSH